MANVLTLSSSCSFTIGIRAGGHYEHININDDAPAGLLMLIMMLMEMMMMLLLMTYEMAFYYKTK